MTNPVLVELTRGKLVESVHRGAVAVVRADGALCFAVGDVSSQIYPRSSLKPLQAMVLVESGAADAFGLTDEHVALACASHSGEPMHVDRIADWLERVGLTEQDLACGSQPTRYEPRLVEMIRSGETPKRLHNNCSGKHAGFLTVARHWDIATAGYEIVDHPVQKAVADVLERLTGLSDLPWGIDGCTAPNFALPLSSFAHALAKMAAPEALDPPCAKAARRIVGSMMAHPELVAGTGRPCTILMRAAGGRAAVKAGAEGYYAAMVPGLGLGIAVKMDDGAGRAGETVMAAILERLALLGDDPAAKALSGAPLTNTRGAIVGERRVTPTLDPVRGSLSGNPNS